MTSGDHHHHHRLQPTPLQPLLSLSPPAATTVITTTTNHHHHFHRYRCLDRASVFSQLFLSFQSSESPRHRLCCGKWGMMIMKIMMRARRGGVCGGGGATGSICQQSRHSACDDSRGAPTAGPTVAAFSLFLRDAANAAEQFYALTAPPSCWVSFLLSPLGKPMRGT